MTILSLPGSLWLVGCGNMAGAMLEGWLAKGANPARITVIRPSGKAVAPGVRVLTAYPEDEAPAVVLLGVKPQMLDEVAPRLAPLLQRETILISILAGVELSALRDRFAAPAAIFRAMPNLPVRLGRGVTALYGEGDAQSRGAVEAMMEALGLVEWLDEEAFQIVTSLAGSSPAYLYRFIDALGRAGEEAGLTPEQARRIALAAIAGAAELALRSDVSPSVLADQVASPGGSTRAGLEILDAALPDLIRETLAASIARTREMARAARRS